jgi:heme-degrading monooxygenase HmoA
MIKVIQERHVKPGKQEELNVLLRQLRIAAVECPGYITGETLINAEDPDHEIVIATWRTLDDWKAWQDNKERKEIAAKIRKLLTKPPKVTVCNVFEWKQD